MIIRHANDNINYNAFVECLWVDLHFSCIIVNQNMVHALIAAIKNNI